MRSSSRLRSSPTYLFQRFDYAARQCTSYSEKHIHLYALVGVVSPVITLVDHYIAQSQIETLYIRLMTASICVPGLVRERLPSRFKDAFHIYFVVATAIVFPFGYGLMLTLNAAFASEDDAIHMQWILQYFIALFIYIQVIPHRGLAVSLWILATAAAILPIAWIDTPNFAELERVLIYPIPAFATALGLGVLTNRHTELLDQERLRGAYAIGASLAHEIRTPLASIQMFSRGVENLLPGLVDAWEKANSAGLDVVDINPNQLKQLKRATRSIRNEVQYSNIVIDMLLLNTVSETGSRGKTELFDAWEAIDEAVERFPFNNEKERKSVQLTVSENFEIEASKALIVHVLFNLIKNALHHVHRDRSSQITIDAERRERTNAIAVHDNGIGIPAYVLPHIFDRFYTTNKTGQGAGIGLSFCRMVMESIGGKITCESVEGEYTTFTLHFNKVED